MANKWTKEQEAAMSLSGKALLVSAAAGSGKTSVLTERIIRRLTDPQSPADLTRMLIVTFTRASAADLKSKIAKALTAALAERPGDKHLTKQLLSLGSAQISTIDSFFQKTVRANFDALDLPASFQTADTAEVLPLCLSTIDSLLETHYSKFASSNSSADDPLARIKNNAFADAIDHLMSGRSDGKLDLLLLDFYNRLVAYPQGIGLLHTCAENFKSEAHIEFFHSLAGKVICEHLLSEFYAYHSYLKKFAESIEFDPDLDKKFSGIVASDTDFCNAMIRALENGVYAEARNVAYTFITGRFPTVRGEVPDSVLAYKAWRAQFKDSVLKKLQPLLQWPAEVLPSQFLRTAALAEALFEFYSDYEKKILAEKKSRGILEYNDIRAALHRLLNNPDGTPSTAAQSIAAQYDEVYIDEYQDTDFLQDRIFAEIGGNRRFMVGDIKQSIYGFRGSEPSVFAGYRRAFPLYTDENQNNTNGVSVFMSNNFRCNEPVIDFTNLVCGFLFSACEKSIGYRPQDDLVFSKEKNENAAPVIVSVFDPKPSKRRTEETTEEAAEEEETLFGAEAAWVAKEIERLLREETLDNGKPITPADISILVRAKSHGIEFARALEALNIPVSSEAASNLMEEPLMVDLLNLLRAVDNPYRDLPLSEYLLSELGGFSLEELTEIRQATPDCKALYDAMLAKAEADDQTLLSEKAKRICNWLEGLRENAATLPADRFLRLLYLDEPFVSYQGDPVLLYLYEQARVYQRSAYCGIYGLIDAMTKLQSTEKVSADAFKKPSEAVTIMTVHHSKGLEYPVVFLCATGKQFNRDDLKKGLLFHRSVGCTSKLYRSDLGEAEESILRLAARMETDADQTEESIRTLYVALTRARERLYVTGTITSNRDTVLTKASLIQAGDRHAILGASSYLSWIIAALQNNQKTDRLPYQLHFYSHEPIFTEASAVALDTNAACENDLECRTESTADETTAFYADILKKQGEYSYPLDFLQGIPTKAAASKLRPDLLDRLALDDDSALEAQLEIMLQAPPAFDDLLLSNQKASAADIGTATHTFLEFCNFERFNQIGVDGESERLVSDGFISEATQKLLNREQLEAFRNSDLMQEILSAKRIYREQKFTLFVPLSELTTSVNSKKLQDHSLFVQGSIDLLLETNDGDLLLIDYKTDRLTKNELKSPVLFEKRLKEAHKSQLTYYQTAIKQLFSKEPDKTYLYSLPLGKAIEL